MLKKELWIGKNREWGEIVILSTSTSTQIPKHKTSQKKKKTEANNTVNKLLDKGS